MDPARELRYLRLVRDLAQKLASERDPRQLPARVLEAAIDLTEAERGYLVVVRAGERGRKLDLVEARGYEPAALRGPGARFSRTVVERVLDRRRALVTTDAEDREVLDLTSVRQQAVRSIVCMPLELRGTTRGVLYLEHRVREEAFTSEDVPLLETFAAQAALALETADTLSEPEAEARPLELLGQSPVMCALREDVDRVARSWDPVLVLGEPGAGKSLAAQVIHRRSERAAEPLVAMECAGRSQAEQEEELLGRAKAPGVSERRSLLVLAGRGTLVLEDVDALAPPLQARLLEVRASARVRAPGARADLPVNCRVVTTSGVDLRARVEDGRFLPRLFYRLDASRVIVPPLRMRPEDLPLLIEPLAQRRGGSLRFGEAALARLAAYAWPGNLHELEALIAQLQGAGHPLPLAARHLPESIREGEGVINSESYASVTLGEALQETERSLVQAALAQHQGNKSRAARALGVSRSTLYQLLERHGL